MVIVETSSHLDAEQGKAASPLRGWTRFRSQLLAALWGLTLAANLEPRRTVIMAADKLTKLFEISIGKLQDTRPGR